MVGTRQHLSISTVNNARTSETPVITRLENDR